MKSRQECVFVTGALGFIGGHLVSHYLSTGKRVVGFGRPPDLPYKKSRLHGFSRTNFTYIEGDIRHPDAVQDAVTSCNPDLIIHSAAVAINATDTSTCGCMHEINVGGTHNVFTANKSLSPTPPPVIVMSSARVHDGLHEPTIDHKSRYGDTLAPYAQSKVDAEKIAREQGGCVVRLSNTFGPWQNPRCALIPRHIITTLQSNVPTVVGGGQALDFMYYSDAVRAITWVGDQAHTHQGNVYIAGTGNMTTVLTIAQMIQQCIGNDRDNLILNQPTQESPQQMSIDSSALHALGWKPQTSLLEGLRQTVAWYTENQSLFASY